MKKIMMLGFLSNVLFFSAITVTSSSLKDNCLNKWHQIENREISSLFVKYCRIMGVSTPEVNELQCITRCRPIFLTETLLTCRDCMNDPEPEENCVLYDNLKIVKDKLVVGEDPLRALHTLPYGIFVSKSTIEGAGLGAFTQIDIPAKQRFGPYGGSLHDKDLDDLDGMKYSWKIRDDNEVINHWEPFYVNALNVSFSNWMRYVNTPSCRKDENLYALLYDRQVYLVNLKPIPAGSELFVWYGVEYAYSLKLDLLECNKDVF